MSGKPGNVRIGRVRLRAVRGPHKSGSGQWYWQGNVYADGDTRTVWTGWATRESLAYNLREVPESWADCVAEVPATPEWYDPAALSGEAAQTHGRLASLRKETQDFYGRWPRWLYAIRHGEWGPVKFGRSTNPAVRLFQMQTGNPEPLTLLATVPIDAGDEAAVHALLAAHRIRGEWFRPCGDVLWIVDAMVAQQPTGKKRERVRVPPFMRDVRDRVSALAAK